MEIGTTARTSSKIELIGNKFQWGITLIPQGSTSGQPNTQLYGGNQVMFKTDTKKQLASWVFLKYFAGPEAQAIYAARTGYFPATISSQETPLLKENYQKYPQKAQAFKEVFQYASIMPPSAALNTIQSDLNKVIEEVLANKISAENAVKKMQANSIKIYKDLAK
jgi:ABC-type glycerol-3-phosphate transport system substrate-binding protein